MWDSQVPKGAKVCVSEEEIMMQYLYQYLTKGGVIDVNIMLNNSVSVVLI